MMDSMFGGGLRQMIHFRPTRLAVMAALWSALVCGILRAEDSKIEEGYKKAAEEMERAFAGAGEDQSAQKSALIAYAEAMVELSDQYVGALADQALIESAMAFNMAEEGVAAEKSLRAAERRTKIWELKLMLVQAYYENRDQQAAGRKYAESLIAEAKASSTKRAELVPFLQALGMKREAAELQGTDKSKSSGAEKDSPDGFGSGQTAPDFTAKDFTTGSSFTLRDYRGKYVLVDFWATWCGPCMEEMPDVIAAYKKYHSKGFEIVGISLDHDEETLRRFLDEADIKWRQVCDLKGWKGDLVQRYGVHSIPSPFLIDKEGKVLGKFRGKDLLDALAEIYGE